MQLGKNYIGQTKRNLAAKFKDHNPSLTNQKTDVTKHISIILINTLTLINCFNN